MERLQRCHPNRYLDRGVKRVLFLCTENACRSQLAEALTNHLFKGKVQAFSAGTRPGNINPMTLTVLKNMGISTSELRSKSLDEFLSMEADLVITLCDSAAESCPIFSKAKEQIHLPFPDPEKLSQREAQGDPEKREEIFISTVNKIRNAIETLFSERGWT